MNRTIAKFVVAAQKDHKEFESRISAIFASGQSGDEALEMLILGIPEGFEVLDSKRLMSAVSSTCCKIKSARISERLQLEVSYERTVDRWFKTQEAADRATYYGDGYPRETSEYPIKKTLVDDNNTTSLNLAALEEQGIVRVRRR